MRRPGWRGHTEHVWEERAHRARRNIAALAASGLGVGELHAEAIRLIDREVPNEVACWATIDPETLVISTMISGDSRIPPEYEPLLAEAEYSPTAEPNRFAALARRRSSVARLSDLSASDRRRSTRLNQVWRPLGLDQELRVIFSVDGACWGAAGMVRVGQDFSERELEFLTAVAPALASATRVAVRSEAHGWRDGARPAIVIIGPAGELRALTPAAEEWQDRINEIAPGRFRLMMQVMAGGARSTSSGGFRARLRDARGQWAILRASPLIGAETKDIAVAIEPASGDQLVGLLLEAYDLSARERDVCREVIAGHATVEISARLFISTHTVQDHLKSIFVKVGVRSRGELVARLRPEDDGALRSNLA